MDEYKEYNDNDNPDERIKLTASIPENVERNREDSHQNQFFELVQFLGNSDFDTEEVLHDIHKLLVYDKFIDITEENINETKILDILYEIIANSDSPDFQQEALHILSVILFKYNNLVIRIFENEFIFVIKDILTYSTNTNTKLIAFNVLIESSKMNELHSFFDDDEFIDFLDTFTSKKFKYQIVSLLSELLKFVRFTIKKCLNIICKIMVEQLEQNMKMGPLDVEIELMYMQSLLSFIERGPIQQRYFLKQNILQYITTKSNKLITEAIIILFKMITILFTVEDKKLLSKYNFLTKNVSMFIDSLKDGENDLSIASLRAIYSVLDRFPLFWKELKSTKLNNFIIYTICEKTYVQKNAAVSLLHLILKVSSHNEVKDIYYNDILLTQLISLGSDEDNEQQGEILDILEIFLQIMPEDEDLYKEIYDLLVENSRIQPEIEP